MATDQFKANLARFVGTWVGHDVLHPAPWSPEGGTGITTYTGHSDLNGLFTIGNDIQKRDGFPDYLAHKVIGYDANSDEYTFYIVDSTGANPPSSARGKWVDNTVTFIQVAPFGQTRFRYTFEGEGKYLFQMALSQNGTDWQPLIDGTYLRQ